MARLINKSHIGGAKHSNYGKTYPLKKSIMTIGANDNCDILLSGGKAVSRQHAFIINYKNNFYLGDISLGGTYWAIKKFIGYYEPIKVFNSLESPSFAGYMEKEHPFELEKEFAIEEDHYFDKIAFDRYYFFDKFIKEPANLRQLVQENQLALLGHKDRIFIKPWFQLQFNKNLVERLGLAKYKSCQEDVSFQPQ